MRQGQQNRRGRGRGRKPQNPLGRNLESNGPDVKIRGNAAHIAEKYATLARDALAAGDMVAGESYLQHAEHYNRIIMANQAQQASQNQQASSTGENMNGAGAGRGRNSGPGEEPKGKQPEVAADGADGNGTSSPSQSGDTQKPASSSAKGGNGADDAGSTSRAKKDKTSDAKDADSGGTSKKPGEAVT